MKEARSCGTNVLPKMSCVIRPVRYTLQYSR